MMSDRKLYRESYQSTKKFGTSYFIATLLMNAKDRRNVYALYSLCRHADDIVDVADVDDTDNARRNLDSFYVDVVESIKKGAESQTMLGAISRTWNELDLDLEYLERFFNSMSMDLTISSYDSFDDLSVYMDGSAAVIGEMVLPILVPDGSMHEELKQYARNLGNAFQLTNFLRDIDEDLQRGRIYIPLEDLSVYGINPTELKFSDNFEKLMSFQIERTRSLYFESFPGVVQMSGRRGACVRTAYRLYGSILRMIEKQSYDVFSSRVRVPQSAKYRIAVQELMRISPGSFKEDMFL